MSSGRHGALAAMLLIGLATSAVAAQAQVNDNEPDPAVWLRQIYEAYHRAEKADAKLGDVSDTLVSKRASKSLAALFKRDDDCVKKEQGVCALDWDYVIDGQDWKLSNIKVGPLVAAGDKATVTVRFTNFQPCVNVYAFVREGGVWKVDDVLTKSGTDAPIGLAKLLKDYDYNQ